MPRIWAGIDIGKTHHHCVASRIFYSRKRTEGKTHRQALLALARRRVNVLWAMIRSDTVYQEPLPIMA